MYFFLLYLYIFGPPKCWAVCFSARAVENFARAVENLVWAVKFSDLSPRGQ